MAIDRREFVQTVGGAGVFAALARPSAAQQAAATDFEKPAGLRPGAQLDSRFPVSFAKPVSEGLRLVMEYFTALSQRDAAAMARTLRAAVAHQDAHCKYEFRLRAARAVARRTPRSSDVGVENEGCEEPPGRHCSK
jgi:hypothetical protein